MKILLLVADSVRADAVDLSPFGGARFTSAWCSGSWTIPSLSAMVTGELPHRVGVANWYHRVSPSQPSLFTRLAAAGFAVDVLAPNPTHAFAGWPGVSSVGNSLDDAEVLATLRRPGPRLVLLHHWGTHLPYLPPGPKVPTWSGLHEASELLLTALARDPLPTAARLRRMYAAAVGRLRDDLLPRWLDALGDGWVVATADHGESWGEHAPNGRVRHIFDLHGRWMEDDTTHVPLQVFHTRGDLAASVVSARVRGVDIGPTVAALAEVPWQRRAPESGRSLLGATHGETLDDVSALTVGTFNCETPDRYPPTGDALWCRWSERDAAGRRTFEAADLPPHVARLHAEAVDSGPMPAEWEARRDEAEARHARVFGSLRRLGYLD